MNIGFCFIIHNLMISYHFLNLFYAFFCPKDNGKADFSVLMNGIKRITGEWAINMSIILYGLYILYSSRF